MYGCVYRIINNINKDVIYVGRTTQKLKDRYKKHLSGNSKIAHGKLYEEFNLYGKDNFVCETICECETKEELYEKEEYWIRFYKDRGCAKYNDSLGNKKSERYKLNTTPWNKGKTNCYSDETRKNMGRDMSGKNNPMFGKVYSKSEKDKHREIMKEYYKNHPEKKNFGKHWYTNGVDNKFSINYPEGYRLGVTRHVKKRGDAQ